MSTDSRQGEGLLADPCTTDPDKYRVVMENDRVRVLEYRDAPGQRTRPHFHRDFVICALSTFQRELTLLPENRVTRREFQPGEVGWGNAQTHIGANVGSTDTHVLLIELKEPRPAKT